MCTCAGDAGESKREALKVAESAGVQQFRNVCVRRANW